MRHNYQNSLYLQNFVDNLPKFYGKRVVEKVYEIGDMRETQRGILKGFEFSVNDTFRYFQLVVEKHEVTKEDKLVSAPAPNPARQDGFGLFHVNPDFFAPRHRNLLSIMVDNSINLCTNYTYEDRQIPGGIPNNIFLTIGKE